jgi:agmatinase
MTFDPDAPASGDGLYGLPTTPDDAAVIVLPVPWEATTSYKRGTRHGPARLHEASLQVDLHDLDVGPAWEHGIAALPEDPEIVAWTDAAEPDALAVIAAQAEDPEAPEVLEAAARVNRLSERLNMRVEMNVREIYARGSIPALVGGDHAVPFGGIAAAAERYPGLGVLHLDAHADLRDAYEGFTWSHASIMHNVMTRLPAVGKLVQVGIRDVGAAEVAFIRENPTRIRTFFDGELARGLARGRTWMSLVDEIVDALPEHVWISFDVDGLDPSWCPATGTPVPGGLSFRDAVILLEAVAERRHIVGFDLNEIGDAEWDGNVAARLLYKLCGWAVKSREDAHFRAATATQHGLRAPG